MEILIIQTAYLGDVILASHLAAQIKFCYPESTIHFLVRKENEQVLTLSPFIDRIWILDKNKNKWKTMYGVIKSLRGVAFDKIINLHRFFSSGIISFLINGKEKIGYDKNPLSFLYDIVVKHQIDDKHELERNTLLIDSFCNIYNKKFIPWLIPQVSHTIVDHLAIYNNHIIIAPCSVWFTKQFPLHKWKELIKTLRHRNESIVLVGAKSEFDYCQQLVVDSGVVNLSGKLTLAELAYLMTISKRVITNDSAPLHLASALNAPLTAIFCSTIPSFGFGPAHEDAAVVEVTKSLPCRPCGLHGKKKCPLGHFQCAENINISQILDTI